MQKLLDYANDPQNRVHALVILNMNAAHDRQGKPLYTVWKPENAVRHPVYSLTKSVLSIGISFLVQEGKLDIRKPLASYLTQEQLAFVPVSKRSDFAALPVTRFLTMSLAGYPFRPEGETDWIAQALSADVDYAQPPTFAYSNFPALLAGVAAQNAADEPFMAYLQRKYLSPAGIPDVKCRLTPEGYFYGASGMELSASELMVLGGYLFHAVRTEPYLAQAVSRRIANERGGYGYFFWVGEDHFYMSGKWGQKCIVSPATGAVISYVSDRPEGDGELFRLALDYLASLRL